MKKCVLFDRDGIVNRSPGPGYVLSWADFHIQEGFVAALRTAADRGYVAVVITNQQCVTKGLITAEALDEMHEKLRRRLRDEHGLELLDVMVCPHGDAHGCACRKPKPGMILDAAARHGIDLALSWMVGDQERDVECGRRAGCRTILVSAEAECTAADYHVNDLTELNVLLQDVLS